MWSTGQIPEDGHNNSNISAFWSIKDKLFIFTSRVNRHLKVYFEGKKGFEVFKWYFVRFSHQKVWKFGLEYEPVQNVMNSIDFMGKMSSSIIYEQSCVWK